MTKKQLIAAIAALLPARPPAQAVFAAQADGIAALIDGAAAAFLAFRFLSGKHKPHGAEFAFEPSVCVAENPIGRALARLSEHLPQIRPRDETAFNFRVFPSDLRERDAVFKNINIAVYPQLFSLHSGIFSSKNRLAS